MIRKLIIEIDISDENKGKGVLLIHALTEMIKDVFDDSGPLYEESGKVYTDYSDDTNDDGEELLDVHWKWVEGHK